MPQPNTVFLVPESIKEIFFLQSKLAYARKIRILTAFSWQEQDLLNKGLVWIFWKPP